MRIAGVLIPAEKCLWISLTYIYGIGRHHSHLICAAAKVDPLTRVKALTSEQEELLREKVREYVVEADLRREVSQNIQRLQEIGSYRGYRHRRRLPVRGQNTKTNARTRRGRKGMAVTKKKVASK